MHQYITVYMNHFHTLSFHFQQNFAHEALHSLVRAAVQHRNTSHLHQTNDYAQACCRQRHLQACGAHQGSFKVMNGCSSVRQGRDVNSVFPRNPFAAAFAGVLVMPFVAVFPQPLESHRQHHPHPRPAPAVFLTGAGSCGCHDNQGRLVAGAVAEAAAMHECRPWKSAVFLLG